jgi:hypothetical protein
MTTFFFFFFLYEESGCRLFRLLHLFLGRPGLFSLFVDISGLLGNLSSYMFIPCFFLYLIYI